jgi:hypothetical protein
MLHFQAAALPWKMYSSIENSVSGNASSARAIL